LPAPTTLLNLGETATTGGGFWRRMVRGSGEPIPWDRKSPTVLNLKPVNDDGLYLKF
jgi:hypothetical protein